MSHTKSGPVRILYMEDNEGQARLLQRKLGRLGYQVEVACDGRAGLDMYQEDLHDVVIVDHRMPEYDGIQVIRALRERGAMPPVIMLTGTGDEVLAVEAMKLGAEDYLVKDSDGRYLELLPSVMQNLLENKWLREEHKAMQEQLIQASKLTAIGELAANIAHEMNNPLGIISAKARLLLSHEKDGMSPKVARELDKIIIQCDRLSRLTRGLLNYARPSVGLRGPIDVCEPLRVAMGLVEHRAQEKRVELVERCHPGTSMINGNRQELEQVFLNLLFNGIEAMPSGGTLTLGVHSEAQDGEEPAVCVSVKDTGEGIAPESLPRIFEPFFTTKAEGQGTGLGLSICFGLVRSHEGTIDVQSVVGEGTTFLLRFPAIGANSS